MARMHAREIDQAFAEDITDQQLEMEVQMELDWYDDEPMAYPYSTETASERDCSMDWAYEDDYDYDRY